MRLQLNTNVRIEKWDSERQGTLPQGDATLEEAVFAIYNRSQNAVFVDGILHQPNQRVGMLTTNAQGVATSADDWLPYGTFEAIEIIAPNGYLNTGEIRRTFTLRENGVMVNLNTASTAIQNDVIRGGVEIEKQDREISLLDRFLNWTGLRPAQGDGTLSDIEFTITNVSTPTSSGDGYVFVDGSEGHRLFGPNEVVHRMYTTYEVRHGQIIAIARTKNDLLPFGTYRIQETATNDSYLLTDGEPRYFQIRANGEMVELTVDGDELIFTNYVVRGDVIIEKYDFELGLSEAMGGTSLEDIGFEIINDSVNPIIYPGPDAPFDIPRRVVMPDEVVTEIFTFFDKDEGKYVARTFDRSLPYGSYIVRETTRNDYYLIPHPETGARFEARFQIRRDGELVRTPTWTNVPNDDHVMRAVNQTIRNDIEFNKIGEVTNQRLSYVPFLVTNRETGEAHVIITDRNGLFHSASSWFEPGYRTPETTNQNNHLLEYVQRGEIIPTSSMNLYTHVWFGIGEDGTIAPIHPTWGAFHYGWYDMVELRSESNQHYDMLEVEFYVSRHMTHNRVLDLGTLTNHFGRIQSLETVARVNDSFSRQFERGSVFTAHDQIRAWHSNIPPLQLAPFYHIDAYLYVVEPDEADETRRRIHEFERITYQLRSNDHIFDIQWEIDHSEFHEEAWFFFAAEMFDEDDQLIYRHNLDGSIPEQSLHPKNPEENSYMTIRTQAHTGDGETQSFDPSLEYVEFHDIVLQTFSENLIGTQLWRSAHLDAWSATGELLERDVWVHGPESFTVTATEMRWEVDVVGNFHRRFEPGTLFTWREQLYSVPDECKPERERDEDGNYVYRYPDECLELEYVHNEDGSDQSQMLWPRASEEDEKPIPPNTNLPQTGSANGSLLTIIIGVSGLALAGILIKLRRLNLNRRVY